MHPTYPPRDPLLIGLTGAAGAGKDTVANHLTDRYGFLQVALAEPLNDMLAAMLEHVEVDYAVLHERALKERPLRQLLQLSPRELKQTLGDWGRTLAPGLWLHIAQHRLGLLPGQTAVHDRIVVSDVRFVNEASWLRMEGGVLVRVERPGAEPVRPHVSETEQQEAAFRAEVDFALHNDSTVGMLHERVDQLCRVLRLEQRDRVM